MKLVSEQTVTVALILGIVCLFVVVVHLPQAREMDRVQKDIAAKRQELSEAHDQCSSLVTVYERVQMLRQSTPYFDKRLPDRSELSGFLKKLVGKLNSAKLVSHEIRPESPVSTARYVELPITLSFEGSFENIYAFLRSVEDIARLTQVEELHLKSRVGPDPVVKATMVLNVYCTRS